VIIRILSNVDDDVDPVVGIEVTEAPPPSLTNSSGIAVTPADSDMSAAMATVPEVGLLLTASRVASTAVLLLRRMARQRPWRSLYLRTVVISATTTPGPRIAPAHMQT
jgi:hypothetical protein